MSAGASNETSRRNPTTPLDVPQQQRCCGLFRRILWDIPTDMLVPNAYVGPVGGSRLMGRPVGVWVYYGILHYMGIPHGIPWDIP